ncbi:transcription termination factor 2-like isoform X2 [Ornithodoros turicata]|uniref:transcription termination factor 2-like isoform X2 n=1 Tax=Ornithodoros turicata TaxID=34597 RepID=UPI003139430C
MEAGHAESLQQKKCTANPKQTSAKLEEKKVRSEAVHLGKQVLPSCADDLQNAKDSKERNVDQRGKCDAKICDVASVGQNVQPLRDSKSKALLEHEIAQKKKIIGTINLSTLPDKGERLKNQIKQLEAQLSTLSLERVAGQQPSSSPEEDKKQKKSDPAVSAQPLKPTKTLSPHKEENVDGLPEQRLQTSPYWSIYKKGVKLVSPMPLKKAATTVPRPVVSNTIGTRVVSLQADSDEHLKKFVLSLETQPREDDEFEQPEGVKTLLLTHQKQALSWLVWKEAQDPPGGILADGMGLGKTLTMLALIQLQLSKRKTAQPKSVNPEGGRGKSDVLESLGTLVICPLSLLHQWVGEAKTHLSATWSVHVYHGKGRGVRHDELVGHDLVVTTYDTVSSEWARATAAGRGLAPLFCVHWERIVLDEAHCIRNPNTKRAKAACALRGRHRWAVSGTPVHNDVGDVRSLLKFLQCAPFDDDVFWKSWMKKHPAPESLTVVIKCLLLRRTKEKKGKDGKPLVSLPEKTILVRKLQLRGIEKDIYDDMQKWSMSSGVEKYVDPVTKRELYRNTGSRFFVMLIRLQQACSHLSLLRKKALDDVAVDEDSFLADCMSSLNISEDLSSSVATADNLGAMGLEKYEGRPEFERAFTSCKIKALLDSLTKVMLDTGDKCVVVSKWTSMLDLAREHIEKSGFRCLVIQGNVNAAKRAENVRSFNYDKNGPRVLLLSLDAGGVGLNLIGGNHMFVLDVHWNPALELQAFDRVHRVGQEKPVTINRFVCTGTIEEKILELQRYKERLAESVVGKRKITMEDYNFLFGIGANR